MGTFESRTTLDSSLQKSQVAYACEHVIILGYLTATKFYFVPVTLFYKVLKLLHYFSGES